MIRYDSTSLWFNSYFLLRPSLLSWFYDVWPLRRVSNGRVERRLAWTVVGTWVPIKYLFCPAHRPPHLLRLQRTKPYHRLVRYIPTYFLYSRRSRRVRRVGISNTVIPVSSQSKFPAACS